MNVPYGYCQCGCGEKTGINKQTRKSRNQKAGEPSNFISGHNSLKGKENPNWLGRKKGHSYYIHIWNPGHPKAIRGYVYEHIAIAEKALGKLLPQKAVIHHHSPEQLVICQDQAYHLLLHKRQRAYEACGNANWLQCTYCHKFDDPENLYIQGKKQSNYHKKCRLEYKRNHYPKYRERRNELRRATYAAKYSTSDGPNIST